MRLWPPARRDRHRPLRIGVMGKGNHDIAPSTIVHLCDDPCDDDDDDDVDAASLRSAADPYRLQFLSPPAPDHPPERRRHAHMRVAHTGRQLRKRMNACANGGGRKEDRQSAQQSTTYSVTQLVATSAVEGGPTRRSAASPTSYFIPTQTSLVKKMVKSVQPVSVSERACDSECWPRE